MPNKSVSFSDSRQEKIRNSRLLFTPKCDVTVEPGERQVMIIAHISICMSEAMLNGRILNRVPFPENHPPKVNKNSLFPQREI